MAAKAGLIAVVLNLFIPAPRVTTFLAAFGLWSFSGALALMLLAWDKTLQSAGEDGDYQNSGTVSAFGQKNPQGTG